MDILITITPFAIAMITSLIKKIKITDWLNKPARKATFRFLAALFSFISVVLGAKISGVEVDAVSIEMFTKTLLMFLSSTGVYYFTKKKKDS